jgi:cytochrome c peroxidase
VIATCAADNVVVVLDRDSLAERGRLSVGPMPWALVVDSQHARAHLTHLHGPGITTLALEGTARVESTREIPAIAPRGHRTLAHGLPRSLYDLQVHPTTGALWVAHELHANDTAQPELDFESTVFPAVSIVDRDTVTTLSTDSRLAGVDGAFGDVSSGPRHISFTHQGQYAYVVAQASEDILVIATEQRVEHSLARPMPGHWPQGLVWTADEQHAFVDLRNSRSIAEITAQSHPTLRRVLAFQPRAIEPSTPDPMPEALRLGQRVFFTANDVEIPTTTNHWMACASCHPEGTTDKITWSFTQGPRDTPSNAGAVYGFLFRTADRDSLTQYWKTIVIEQGGHFSADDQVLAPYLHAVAGFVERAIPAPPAPTTDPARVLRGRVLFERADTQCVRCHYGPAYSDSGAQNPTLNLAGIVRLWDVGTCHSQDRAHTDFVGHRRGACAFDTPALRGIAESAPYLHDGSAASLTDVLTTRNRGDRHGHTSQLSPTEIADLVEFLRSL